ncbi:OadG family protein [Aporhodopirellula aestuarii]|nr:OadG family protein [Aporhodopirellula aestuarii]
MIAEASTSRFAPLFLETGFPLAIMGMVVVFMALTVLILIISSFPFAMRRLELVFPESNHHGAKPKKQSQPAPAVSDDGTIPAHILAVIAAAVAETESGPVRIVRTRHLTTSELAWTLEGRIRHHASHRLQTRNR